MCKTLSAAFPDRAGQYQPHEALLQTPVDAGGLTQWTPAASTPGYAFESALCMIESQSPVAQVLRDGVEFGSLSACHERNAEALLSRTTAISRVLASVRNHLDAEDSRTLLEAAARVVRELIAIYGNSVHGAGRVDRRVADFARHHAERLAEQIGSIRISVAPVAN